MLKEQEGEVSYQYPDSYEVTESERDMAKTNRPTESDKESRNLLLKADAT